MRDRCYAGFLFDELEQYDEAIAELDALLTEVPENYVALNNRGVMCWEIGQMDQAERDLRTACTLATNDALPHENMGRFLRDRGERDLAIASYRRAIAISPHSTTARAGLAGLLSAD
jgi:Flp pilus assembly protein TadD